MSDVMKMFYLEFLKSRPKNLDKIWSQFSYEIYQSKKKDERTSQLHKIAVLAFISTSGCLGNKIENRKCTQT